MHTFKIIAEGRLIQSATVTLMDRAGDIPPANWTIDQKSGAASARLTTRDAFLRENKHDVERITADDVRVVRTNTFTLV